MELVNHRCSFKSNKSSSSINRCKSIEITEVNFMREEEEIVDEDDPKTQTNNLSSRCSNLEHARSSNHFESNNA